jgi:hypothetical protein
VIYRTTFKKQNKNFYLKYCLKALKKHLIKNFAGVFAACDIRDRQFLYSKKGSNCRRPPCPFRQLNSPKPLYKRSA